MRPLKVTPCFMIVTGERNLVIRIIAFTFYLFVLLKMNQLEAVCH